MIHLQKAVGTGIIDRRKVIVILSFGTLLVFLNKEFPHEVFPALRDRYAIAGWFRLNTSITNTTDPSS